MIINLTVNGTEHTLNVHAGELLRTALRRLRYYSVKHGDETGEAGADAVLLTFTPEQPTSYRLLNAGTMLAAQADGASIVTAEGLVTGDWGSGIGNRSAQATPPQSPVPDPRSLVPLQEQFVQCGAIQCGYGTPAQLLAAQKLLSENPDPTEAEVREAIAGVLCRCTGYLKPVQAILRTAALRRGETLDPLPVEIRDVPDVGEWPSSLPDSPPDDRTGDGTDTQTRTRTVPVTVASPKTQVVNKPEPKVDAVKLVKGRGVFADDVEMPGMLYGGLLTSPHAHARIRNIDKSKAVALPGVHAVLTHEDVERVIYASGGQSYPNPPPYDQVSLDNKVRHVGDRVAVVAAETPELVQQALELIEVDYEILPAVFDPLAAMADGAPVIRPTRRREDPRRRPQHRRQDRGESPRRRRRPGAG
ncbi:MAG: 2Fe-2S iron-sulfur cluster-binding protein [Caldilineaceae bacterium]